MSESKFVAVPGVNYSSESFMANCHAQEVREAAKRGQATMAELIAAEQAAEVAASRAHEAFIQRYGDEDDTEQDDRDEMRREYHDMLDRDFQRLGLVER